MGTIKMDFLRDGTESMKEIKGGDLAFILVLTQELNLDM